MTFYVQTSPECSPLSCNSLAAEVETNTRCLLQSFEQARALLENGTFNDSEPGPYRIFAVYSVSWGWGPHSVRFLSERARRRVRMKGLADEGLRGERRGRGSLGELSLRRISLFGPGSSSCRTATVGRHARIQSPIMKGVRVSVVVAGLALTAGWAFRWAFPPMSCPRCGSRAWKRLGGGLKRCTRCSHSFFAKLENPKPASRR